MYGTFFKEDDSLFTIRDATSRYLFLIRKLIDPIENPFEKKRTKEIRREYKNISTNDFVRKKIRDKIFFHRYAVYFCNKMR